METSSGGQRTSGHRNRGESERPNSQRGAGDGPSETLQKGVGWIETQPIYLIINVSEKLQEERWRRVLGEKQVAKYGVT